MKKKTRLVMDMFVTDWTCSGTAWKMHQWGKEKVYLYLHIPKSYVVLHLITSCYCVIADSPLMSNHSGTEKSMSLLKNDVGHFKIWSLLREYKKGVFKANEKCKHL